MRYIHIQGALLLPLVLSELCPGQDVDGRTYGRTFGRTDGRTDVRIKRRLYAVALGRKKRVSKCSLKNVFLCLCNRMSY